MYANDFKDPKTIRPKVEPRSMSLKTYCACPNSANISLQEAFACSEQP